jgi:hypothetical protein
MLQAHKMEMMYTIIADEFKSMDNKDMRPEDYLNFFCLGNREEPPSNGSPKSEKSTDKSAAVVCFCIFSLFLRVWLSSTLLITPKLNMVSEQIQIVPLTNPANDLPVLLLQ